MYFLTDRFIFELLTKVLFIAYSLIFLLYLGPIFWPGLFATCAGDRQSPIAITKKISTPATFFPFMFFNYNRVPTSAMILNNGHAGKLFFLICLTIIILRITLFSVYTLELPIRIIVL